jgi:N-acylglucosamine 2-epimerase
MAAKQPKSLTKKKFTELGAFYRRMLLERVMPFWETHTRDADFGGYHTGLDMAGNITNPNKYIWAQARQLWMFSALYNRVDKRPHWLDLARHGREFIVKYAYAGNGRWNYKLDRAGNVKKGTISIATDLFALSGLVEHMRASGSEQDMPLIRATWDTACRNMRDPEFKDVWHGTWNPLFKGMPMLIIHLCGQMEPLLGAEATRPVQKEALRQMLHVFSKDECGATFEKLSRKDDSVVDTPEGRALNPGHALEALWFVMDEARRQGDAETLKRAIKVAEYSWERGHDAEHGGIFCYVDYKGATPPAKMAYHKHTDMAWDDKCWWVHSESLVTFGMAAVLGKSEVWMQRFMDLHGYCWKNFYAPEYGTWYPTLYRDGRPKIQDHGQAWDGAYHLPRAMMMLMLLFEGAAAK